MDAVVQQYLSHSVPSTPLSSVLVAELACLGRGRQQTWGAALQGNRMTTPSCLIWPSDVAILRLKVAESKHGKGSGASDPELAAHSQL